MIRCLTIVCALVAYLTPPATADDSLLMQYIKDFSGRWVCDTVADQDIEGYWKKGDKLRMENVITPSQDQTCVRWEWQAFKDGKMVGNAEGMITWDAGRKTLKTLGAAPPAFMIDETITKDGEKWVNNSIVIYPDATKHSTTVTTTIQDEGDTHSDVATNRLDGNGSSLPDSTDIWRRVSKNHEVLNQQLGWIIGTWTGKTENPVTATQEVEATYKWVADEQVIQADVRIGDRRGLSIILYDPSDGRVKMWGANSAGGNGQAVLSIDGDSLVWTNTTYDQTGKKRISDFSFEKTADGKSFLVEFTRIDDGQQGQVTMHKQ